jgi:hypothetical protein
MVRAELYQQAEQTARAITDPDRQARALADLAEAMARAKLYQRAEQTARTITDPDRQAWALAGLARVKMARAGQQDEAARLADLAEQTARTIPNSTPKIGR